MTAKVWDNGKQPSRPETAQNCRVASNVLPLACETALYRASESAAAR